MKNRLLNLLFLTLWFITQGAYAVESLSAKRLDPQAKQKADSLYNQAQRAYSHGNYKQAIVLYKESYEYKPAADAANNLAATYEQIKDYDEAIKWYRLTIDKYQDKDAIFNLAFLYDDKLSNYDKAIVLYKKAFSMGKTDGGGKSRFTL